MRFPFLHFVYQASVYPGFVIGPLSFISSKLLDTNSPKPTLWGGTPDLSMATARKPHCTPGSGSTSAQFERSRYILLHRDTRMLLPFHLPFILVIHLHDIHNVVSNVCTAASVLETAQASACFLAATQSKELTRVFTALKSAFEAIKFESLLKSCLENRLFLQLTASSTHLWYLSHPRNLRCGCTSKHARPPAVVPQHASRPKSRGSMNLHIMYCSEVTFFCSGHSIFLCPKSGSCFL